jgi:hypothetical protein
MTATTWPGTVDAPVPTAPVTEITGEEERDESFRFASEMAGTWMPKLDAILASWAGERGAFGEG